MAQIAHVSFNAFQPIREIGSGAFGIVWECTDPRLRRRVALKKVPNIFMNLMTCLRTFREIRMLSGLRHDNVLSMIDILQPANSRFYQELYVITELMQSDLHRIIFSHQPLTIDHIKLFMYQLLRGLKYLHSANIMHRDIKPGNLLVNPNCLLKICDFGLARLWDRENAQNMTHEVVTQCYRAPELLMGARKYTAAIDVWSVGCILAELLQRRILFEAPSPIEQLDMIIDLFGTPAPDAMRDASEGAKNHVNAKVPQGPKTDQLVQMSPQMDPNARISVAAALAHPYLFDGRQRFHADVCTCCDPMRRADDLEPAHTAPFDPQWEEDLGRMSMFELRDKIYQFVLDRVPPHGIRLCIDPQLEANVNVAGPALGQGPRLSPRMDGRN
ncbi:unnamed protein product [Caenorhabditis sp. 36 PRJEB53466]|nr:unnamed protein product [Caenorhabditis sp. 36 PRJEB53466]